MHKSFYLIAFILGLVSVVWVGAGFIGTSPIALAMTGLIAAVFVVGALEVRRFRAATAGLDQALAGMPDPVDDLEAWIGRVPEGLRQAVRQRLAGERVALPGLPLAPYLVGLLVMLGMLGTFLGMVMTFKGAVFALEGSTDLQAIRSALAAPIRGLGFSFGTSVAGVATSALLGLMAAWARRERLRSSRRLDDRIAGALRPFSMARQREDVFQALRQQSQVLPEVAGQLQALMERIEQRGQQLDEQLLARQSAFHQQVGASYTALAQSVERTLGESLRGATQAAGESLRPVLESAMRTLVSDGERLHARVGETVQAQLDGVSRRFGEVADKVSAQWGDARSRHEQTQAAWAQDMARALQGFTQHVDQAAGRWLDTTQAVVADAQAKQQQQAEAAQQAWAQALAAMAGELRDQWQAAGAGLHDGQQALLLQLNTAAASVAEAGSRQVGQALAEVSRLVEQSDALLRARTESEAQWRDEHARRMDEMAAQWRGQMEALRAGEAERGQAAVDRLAQLEAAVATQLATLGQALEAPLGRLLETASEAPRAAAEVIARLRQEMSGLAERDNAALEERARLMAQVDALLQGVQQATAEQRGAVEQLVASAGQVLDQVGRQFAETVGAQAGRAETLSAQVGASVADLAALGEAFQQGLAGFSAVNAQLADGLQRVERAIGESMARSDEQLAYYVAQAREVIDLSITAQQGVLEDLRQLRQQPVARVEEGAGS